MCTNLLMLILVIFEYVQMYSESSTRNWVEYKLISL